VLSFIKIDGWGERGGRLKGFEVDVKVEVLWSTTRRLSEG